MTLMTIQDPICGVPVDTEISPFMVERLGKTYHFCSEECALSFVERPRIAYFSMEIGIHNDIPTYSGGLGVLAGDTIRSSADLRLPLVAVTLLSRKGYLLQRLTEAGDQIDAPQVWDPSHFLELLPDTVTVSIEERPVKVQSWLYEYQSPTGSLLPILFLDTNLDRNTLDDRTITDSLYGGDERYRFKQEIVLGIGGTRLLDALGYTVRKYHMNEGHSSLLTLELLQKNEMNADQVKNLCVFTTHTPVESAFDKYSYELVTSILELDISLETLQQYGGSDYLNMTLLALNLSRYENGVTNSHMEFSRKLFPGHHIYAITNGVHSYTWTSPSFRTIYDTYIPGWAREPSLLVRIDSIPNEEIWTAHLIAKRRLLEYVHTATGMELDPSLMTIGFARRATAYKRATLLFSNIEKLKNVNDRGRIQLIFAGKAHPRDDAGKRLIKDVFHYKAQLKPKMTIVYLENYDMTIASKLTAGVDVWLNTPLPPLEASGTSGMKAAHNGVVNFSVLDGWWIEGCIEGVTGWSIGPAPTETIDEGARRKQELDDLYNKLQYVILPTFYQKRDEWIQTMKHAIGKVAYYFNSHRMMRRYSTEAYLL